MSTIATARGRLDAAPSRIDIRFALAAFAGVVLIAFSAIRALPERPTDVDPAPAAAPASAPADRIAYVVAGIPAEVAADTVIPVGGSVTARVALEKRDGRAGSRDLVIALADGAGAPLDGAAVHLIGQMRYMDHGIFEASPEPAGGGTYTAHLQFAMPGEYEVRVDVGAASSTGSFVLDLDLR